jgi:uncharacterized protein YpmB
MKKWILLVIMAVLLVVSWRAVALYKTTLEPKTSTEDKAINTALEDELFETVDQVDTYYGTHEYQVITGKDLKGESIIAWIPAKGEPIIKKKSDGVTEKEAISGLYTTLENLYDTDVRDPQEIRSIKLGIEDDIPIWEIIYVDKRDRLTYYRSYFETGQYWKFIKP